MRRMACFMRAKVQQWFHNKEYFFDFLQFCIGDVAEIPASVKDADWKGHHRLLLLGFRGYHENEGCEGIRMAEVCVLSVYLSKCSLFT